jgi:hypothetical protein
MLLLLLLLLAAEAFACHPCIRLLKKNQKKKTKQKSFPPALG